MFVAIFFVAELCAQQYMVIKTDNGTTKLPINIINEVSFETITAPIMEKVDMGLSVKWATCNIGASKPEEYGDYYAWGETITKLNYTESNSITHGKSISDLQSSGVIDAKNNLTANYDAASKNWGGTWRMPTLEEFCELLDKNNCTWSWTTKNGVYGRLVTSKKNGNNIFLPAAGYRNGTSLIQDGSWGYYWSPNARDDTYSYYSYCPYFNADFYGWYLYCDYRYYGLSVRPVSK